MNPRTVVAAVDFSEASCEVVQTAVAVARDSGGALCLVHAVPHVIQAPWMVESPGMDLEDLQRGWVSAAEAQLAELAASLRLDPRRTSLAVVIGPAAAAIVRYAADRGADVLVLGSHGRGVIRRFLLGSVVERVLRDAGCAVLVVPDRALRAAAGGVRTMRAAGAGHAA